MRLGQLTQNRLTLHFEYYRLNGESEEIIARGEQEIACMNADGDQLVPTPIPKSLRTALEAYGG
jgi:enediyne biosynthesis thioesterase